MKQDDPNRSSSWKILRAFPKASQRKTPEQEVHERFGSLVSSPSLLPLTRITGEPAEVFSATLSGYRFLACVEQNPLGEVWKVQGPRGKLHLAQFLPPGEAADLLRACERLAALTHAGLAPVQVVRLDAGLVLLTDLHEQTLRERFQECWSQGLPGIPRDELLSYIRTAAAILDVLVSSHQLQHLGLNPRNLLLQRDRLQIGGFGLGQLVWAPTRQTLALLNPRYAAPELWHNRVSWTCDQYSLALIYAEMLSGVHPLRTGAKRARSQRRTCPDLGLISAPEREVLRRALHVSSSRRFANCSQLALALHAATQGQEKPAPAPPPKLGPVLVVPHPFQQGRLERSCTSLNDFVAELVALVTGPVQVQDYRSIRYTIEPGRLLEHRCPLRGAAAMALPALEQFQDQWQARTLHHEKGMMVFALQTTPTFWQRLIGRQVGLEIQVQVLPPTRATKCAEVAVVIRPFGCSRQQAVHLLADLGPRVLASVRSYLDVRQDQRGTERLLVSQPLRVHPVVGGVELAESIDCITKDISATGIGFFLPRWLPTSQVYVNLPNVEEVSRFAGLAKIVRKQPCGDGWFEVGASFALHDQAEPPK